MSAKLSSPAAEVYGSELESSEANGRLEGPASAAIGEVEETESNETSSTWERIIGEGIAL